MTQYKMLATASVAMAKPAGDRGLDSPDLGGFSAPSSKDKAERLAEGQVSRGQGTTKPRSHPSMIRPMTPSVTRTSCWRPSATCDRSSRPKEV